MAFDRDTTLRNAERALRSGRLEAAIAEYARLLEASPRDWTTMNALGDLYVRAGQPARAIGLYGRLVNHHLAEGFLAHAAALLRKILKIDPADENALLTLADVSVAQGLLGDARVAYRELERLRRHRGDDAAADEAILRIELLDGAEAPAAVSAVIAETAAPQMAPAVEPVVSSTLDPAAPAPDLAPQPRPAATPEAPAAPAADLEAIFAGIRARIETQAPDGDPSEYMALGTSFAEMGRVDEAIDAFTHAARSPRFRFVAGVRLAQLLRDRGDVPAAIEWYERAAVAPPPSEEDAHLLLYDLGDLLEMMGETERALAVFLELGAAAPGYREVADRISRLSNGAVGG